MVSNVLFDNPNCASFYNTMLNKLILSMCINIKHVLHQCRSKGDDDMNTPRANNDYYKKQINVLRKIKY